jgi:predicted enzyme related to lactoylglutathione lyase
MSERDDYMPGVPCWVDTPQPDPRAAVSFYGGLFGWEFSDPAPMRSDPHPTGEYFVARVRGRDVAGVLSEPPKGAPTAWNTHIQVESADQTAEKVKAAGGTVLDGPFDAEPAGRVAVAADPSGAVFFVWEPHQRTGAQLVNEAGAWSWTQLNTRDPEGAKSFYGNVFGWGIDTMDMGEAGEYTMFRVPGYVGGEPTQPVSRDVVAGMAAMGDEFPADVPPHWSIDFWVDDVDATAARAADLGGRVIAEPFDTPIARQAKLADPPGATFTVSKVRVGR